MGRDSASGKIDSYANLNEQVRAATATWEAARVRVFRELRVVDPELADSALDTLRSEGSAASWLARKHAYFGMSSAYGALEAGERDRVMQMLGAIKHGIYL